MTERIVEKRKLYVVAGMTAEDVKKSNEATELQKRYASCFDTDGQKGFSQEEADLFNATTFCQKKNDNTVSFWTRAVKNWHSYYNKETIFKDNPDKIKYTLPNEKIVPYADTMHDGTPVSFLHQCRVGKAYIDGCDCITKYGKIYYDNKVQNIVTLKNGTSIIFPDTRDWIKIEEETEASLNLEYTRQAGIQVDGNYHVNDGSLGWRYQTSYKGTGNYKITSTMDCIIIDASGKKSTVKASRFIW